MVTVSREHIEIVEGASGPKVRIVGSRIRVQDVVFWHEQMGMSVDQMVEEFPTITRADIYAALAYYWDHRDEIDAEVERQEAYVAEMRVLYPSRVQEKLRQMQRETGERDEEGDSSW